MNNNITVGIDIGGTSIKVGLVDENNTIVDKVRFPTNRKIETSELIEKTVDQIHELFRNNQLDESYCNGIGIGCPGIIDSKKGVVRYANNLSWNNLPLAKLLAEKFNYDVEIRLANDADAAALGEVYAGAAKGHDNALLLTLGTGVGGGVVIDRKVFQGPLIGGCEIGHMIIQKNGIRCSCGNRGCFEVYASKNALLRIATRAAKEHPESIMNQKCRGNLRNMRGWIPFDAAKEGDEAAKKVIAEYENNIACGLSNLINIFRPEIVIIGGGVSEQKENLTVPLRRKVEKLCYGKRYGEIPEIVTSKLGNDAGIIGAACLLKE